MDHEETRAIKQLDGVPVAHKYECEFLTIVYNYTADFYTFWVKNCTDDTDKYRIQVRKCIKILDI